MGKTKSADGVSFEAFATAENKSEVNLNFKDAELELKNKIDQAGTYTIDATVFKVADGIDLKACFVTPDATGKQATKETAIAASFAFGKDAQKADKAGWVDKDAAVGVEIKLGSAYKLSDCATVKSKLTIVGASQAPVVDFAWVQKFGNGSLTLSNQFAETHAFGVSYTLDA